MKDLAAWRCYGILHSHRVTTFMTECFSKIQYLLFDYGGTLDADGEAWPIRFYHLYRKHGLEIPFERFQKGFYASEDSLTGNPEVKELGLLATLELQVARTFEYLGLEKREIHEMIVNQFYRDSLKRIERNRPLLEKLASFYSLGILSNFYGNLETILEEQGLKRLFELRLESARVGKMKPDPSFFQLALNFWKCDPSEVLMIGDSLHRDMQGAKGVQIPHIWLCDERNRGKEPCCKGDRKITSLSELESILLSREVKR